MNTHSIPPRTPRRDVALVGRIALVGTLILPILLALAMCLAAACSGPEAPPAKSRAQVTSPRATAPDAGLVAPSSCAPTAVAKPVALPRGARLHRSRRLPGGITLRIHRANYGDVLTLHRGSRLLHAQEGYRFQMAEQTLGRKRSPLAGRDITGDGQPNLVVREWSGGAHCCNTFTVFQVGRCFRTLATLNGGHGGRFTDLDGDGTLEYLAPDAAVHHWGHYYVWQMAPEVIYAWRPARSGQRAGYHASAKHMRRRAPKKSELARWRKQIRRGRRGTANCCRELFIFEDLLRLLYTGHEALAWRHLDRTWEKGWFPRKAAIKQRMKRILGRSHAWRALSADAARALPKLARTKRTRRRGRARRR